MLGCGTKIIRPSLEILERPSKFPERCEIVEGTCIYQPAVIWDHASDSKSCLSQQEFIIITGHIVSLNHVIDRYEAMINVYNLW